MCVHVGPNVLLHRVAANTFLGILIDDKYRGKAGTPYPSRVLSIMYNASQSYVYIVLFIASHNAYLTVMQFGAIHVKCLLTL